MKNIFLSENVRFDEITQLYTCVIKFSGIHVVQKITLITFSGQSIFSSTMGPIRERISKWREKNKWDKCLTETRRNLANCSFDQLHPDMSHVFLRLNPSGDSL